MSEASPDKSIAILQSNYIPWKGYFDIIASVDEFVIFDDVQFTRRDWRNRNKIVLNGSLHWLTIPVLSKGRYLEPIDAITVADHSWARRHWETIAQAYGKSPHFSEIGPQLKPLFQQAADVERLTDINELFLRELTQILSLDTKFSRSASVPRLAKSATGRLVEICQARGATKYVSGPAARSYIEIEQFEAAGVELRYANYSGYPAYGQGLEPFEHGVSIIDVLMCCGEKTRLHLRSLCDESAFLEIP